VALLGEEVDHRGLLQQVEIAVSAQNLWVYVI
jgi:hypothetical protein